jgi:glycosyltransferase involved in cell wall biosynthesis
MKPKKVLHILAEIKFSGAEVMLNLAANYFIEKGVELHVFALGDQVGDYAPVLQKSGFKIHHVPTTRNLDRLIAVYKFFKKNKFDVIHMHFEGAFFWFALVIWMARGANTIVRTVHNVFPYKGYLRFRRILQRFISRKIFKITFVTIGNSVQEVENKTLCNKTTYVPNWLDFDKFQPLQDPWERIETRNLLGIPQDSIVLVSVGATTTIKNHKDIIEALSMIDCEAKKILYLNIGDGPEQSSLKNLCKELGVEKYVKFAGQRKDIRNILVSSDIYLMTSQHEGLSIALLEAMTTSICPIVYNSYGLRDLVTNEDTGLLIEKSPEKLAKAILRLVDDKATREKLARNARSMVLEKYNMKKSLNKLMKIYFPNLEKSFAEVDNLN